MTRNIFAVFMLLLTIAAAESKMYCQDNSTLIIENNKTANGKEYVERETYSCLCSDNKCLYSVDYIAFSILSFVTIFAFMQKNIIVKIIGALMLIVCSVFLIIGITVTDLKGIPFSIIRSEFLAYFILGISIISIAYNLYNINK